MDKKEVFICVICGAGVNIRGHHIIPRRFNGIDEEPNIIYLCDSCHKLVTRYHRAIESHYKSNPNLEQWVKGFIRHKEHEEFCTPDNCVWVLMGVLRYDYCWCSDKWTDVHTDKCIFIQMVYSVVNPNNHWKDDSIPWVAKRGKNCGQVNLHQRDRNKVSVAGNEIRGE